MDGSGNVYVAGFGSDNAFRIAADGTITRIIEGVLDSGEILDGPAAIAADPWGLVYVAGLVSNNAFEIRPDGTVTRMIGPEGLLVFERGIGGKPEVAQSPLGRRIEDTGWIVSCMRNCRRKPKPR